TQIILVRTTLGSKRTKFDLNVTPLHAARITWPPPGVPFGGLADRWKDRLAKGRDSMRILPSEVKIETALDSRRGIQMTGIEPLADVKARLKRTLKSPKRKARLSSLEMTRPLQSWSLLLTMMM